MSLKRYTGSAWVDCDSVKRYNGSAWVDCDSVKRYNGSAWVDVWTNFQWSLSSGATWVKGQYIEFATTTSNRGNEAITVDFSYTLPTSITSIYVEYDVVETGDSYGNVRAVMSSGNTGYNLINGGSVSSLGTYRTSTTSTSAAGKTIDKIRIYSQLDTAESSNGFTVRIRGFYVNGVNIVKI